MVSDGKGGDRCLGRYDYLHIGQRSAEVKLVKYVLWVLNLAIDMNP